MTDKAHLIGRCVVHRSGERRFDVRRGPTNVLPTPPPSTLLNTTQHSCDASFGPRRPRKAIKCSMVSHSRRTFRDAQISTAAALSFCNEVQKVTTSSERLEEEGGFYLCQPLSRRTGAWPHFMQTYLHDIGLEKAVLE